MDSKMSAYHNLEAWKKDIGEIKNNLVERRENFSEKKESFDEREAIKEFVRQKTAPILEKREKKEGKIFKEETPITNDDLQSLERVVSLAKADGIIEAAKFVAKSKNPWLIDAFHDRIVEEVEKEFKQQGSPLT